MSIAPSGSLDGDRNLVPSLYDLSKVRLHIGAASPTTFFVSRPRGHMGEGETMTSEEWEAEVGRMVQVTANTVSAAFYQGAAACHISMTGRWLCTAFGQFLPPCLCFICGPGGGGGVGMSEGEGGGGGQRERERERGGGEGERF